MKEWQEGRKQERGGGAELREWGIRGRRLEVEDDIIW